MKIEVGESYAVSAQWKKSLCEIEQYKHEETGKMLNTEKKIGMLNQIFF